MRDAGCGMRDAGCGMRDAGCGMRENYAGLAHSVNPFHFNRLNSHPREGGMTELGIS